MQIRDTRNDEWYWVNNAVLACPHITSAEKCVYSSLATFSGCQEIHPNFETIASRAAVTDRMAMKAVKRLIEVGYISVKRGGGRGNANTYNLLKRPNGCKICTSKGEQKNSVFESSKRVNKTTIKGEQNIRPIDKEIDKEIDNAKTSFAFSLKDELEKMKKDPKRHIQLIGEYLEEKRIPIENKDQLQVAIKRHVRAAVDLAKFSDTQIGRATLVAEKEYKAYTLETLVKIITR